MQHQVFPEHHLRLIGADGEALAPLQEAPLDHVALEKRPGAAERGLGRAR